jgi:hypothetical protein
LLQLNGGSLIFVKGESPAHLRRWFAETGDIRHDAAVLEQVSAILKAHGARSVGMFETIIGCPHEEGIDYPEGEACPACPFWAGRDRFAGVGT